MWKNGREKTEMAIVERVKNRVWKCAQKEQNSELTGIELTARHLEFDLRPSSHAPLGLKPRRFRICHQNCWAADQSVVAGGSNVSLIKD
jgi:hypothetical protein